MVVNVAFEYQVPVVIDQDPSSHTTASSRTDTTNLEPLGAALIQGRPHLTLRIRIRMAVGSIGLLLLSSAAASSLGHELTDQQLRASQGLGRDTKCIEPPPPLQNVSSGSSLHASHSAPPHLKYLGLDGYVGDDVPWTSLGFMSPGNGWNTTRLRQQKANNVAMMVNFQGITVPEFMK